MSGRVAYCFNGYSLLQQATSSLGTEYYSNISYYNTNGTALIGLYLGIIFAIQQNKQLCQMRPPFTFSDSQESVTPGMILWRNFVASRFDFGCFAFLFPLGNCLCKQRSEFTERQCEEELSRICCYRRITTEEIDPWIRSAPNKVLVVAMVMYIFTIPTAIIGCIIAVVVWLKNKELQTVTNAFLINLVINSGLTALLRLPVQVLDTWYKDPHPWIISEPWWFADVTCRLYRMIRDVNMIATIYFLVLIGYERYHAICHPLDSQRQLSRGRARKLIAGVWLVAIALSVPNLVIYAALLGTEMQGYLPICDQRMYDGAIAYEDKLFYTDFYHIYQLSVAVSQFLIPSFVLLIVYGGILITLIRRARASSIELRQDANIPINPNTMNEINQRRQRNLALRKAQKATFICCYCLAAFVILWAPLQIARSLDNLTGIWRYHLAFLYTLKTAWVTADNLVLYDAIASFFTFLNPVIYCGMSRQWQMLVRKMFRYRSGSVVHALSNRTLDEPSSSSTASAVNSHMDCASRTKSAASINPQLVSGNNDAHVYYAGNVIKQTDLQYRRRAN